MTEEQEAHLDSIIREAANLIDDKYRKGQKEHGGDLIDNTEDWLLEQAILEAVDQVVYLLTLKQKRRKAAEAAFPSVGLHYAVYKSLKTGKYYRIDPHNVVPPSNFELVANPPTPNQYWSVYRWPHDQKQEID